MKTLACTTCPTTLTERTTRAVRILARACGWKLSPELLCPACKPRKAKHAKRRKSSDYFPF